jgi:hypothetical protein
MSVVADKIYILKDRIDLLNYNKNKLYEFISENRENDLNNQSIENDSLSNQNSNTNQNDSDTSHNIRQLRSTRSNNNVNSNSNLGKKAKENALKFEILFNIENNDWIKNLITNVEKMNPSQDQFLKFKLNLSKFLSKFDSFALSQLFKIHSINKSSNLNSDINTDQNSIVEFYVSKSQSLADLKSLEIQLNNELDSSDSKLNDEYEKRKKYRTEALRRKHNYDEFIVTYLKTLAENGRLADILKNSLNQNSDSTNPTSTTSQNYKIEIKDESNKKTNSIVEANSNSQIPYIPFNSLFLPQLKKQRRK